MFLLNILLQTKNYIALLKVPIMSVAYSKVLNGCKDLSKIYLLSIFPLKDLTSYLSFKSHTPIFPLQKTLGCELLFTDEDKSLVHTAFFIFESRFLFPDGQ